MKKRLQALSPWAARLCLAVERFARELLPGGIEGRSLVLALSGGPDSTALAAIMKLLSGRLDLTLAAAYLDHGLRPESGGDAAFCARFCSDLGIPLYAAARDVAALARECGAGIEDAGRQARYAWLREILEETGACAVATGHHLDDLAVDQLMRIKRGAGWPALGGMPAWDPGRRLLRPLLMTPRADLPRLLEELGLTWREDSTNADRAFTRNRIRLDILPLFVRENPDYLGACAELWRQARVDQAHWDDTVSAAEREASALQAAAPPEAHFPAKEPPDKAPRRFLPDSLLRASSQALRLRLYKRAVESLGPGQPLSEALHRLDEAWRNRATGKRFQFPGGKEALVTREGIRFHPGPLQPGVDTWEGWG